MEGVIAALVAGGAIGYALKADGKTVVPVSVSQLRESKPEFYKTVEIDTSEARDDKEYPFEGTLLYIENPTTPTADVYIRFNEPEHDTWNLTELRKIRAPFYRFFITNAAGSGTLRLKICRDFQVDPYEGEVTVVGTILNAISDVSAPSPSDEEILGWDSTAEAWIAYALTELALFASHRARHQDGGLDEINVAGLLGLLAADQHVLDAEVLAVAAALVHASRHQDGGDDEVSVTGLSGLLADDQHVLDSEVVAVAIAKSLMTTQGDLLIRGVSAPEKLAKITTGQVLKATATSYEGVALPVPFTEIGDTTLTGGAASVEFGSIPAGYATFMLLWHDVYGDNAAAQSIVVTFNSDGGNNYDFSVQGMGSITNTTHADIRFVIGQIGDTDGNLMHSSGQILIFNRASQEKIIQGFDITVYKAGENAEDAVCRHLEAKWRNVADEISTITIAPSVGNFVAGSRFILLGLKT